MAANLRMQFRHSQTAISTRNVSLWIMLLFVTANSQPAPELISPLLEKFDPYPPPIPTPDITDTHEWEKSLKDKNGDAIRSNSYSQIHGAYERGYQIHKQSRDKLQIEIKALKSSMENAETAIAGGKAEVERLGEELAQKRAERAAKEAADAADLAKRLKAAADKKKAKQQKDLYDAFTTAQKEAEEKRRLQAEKLFKQMTQAQAEAERVAAALKSQEDALAAIKAAEEKEKERYAAMDLTERATYRDERRTAQQAKDMLKKTKMKAALKKLKKMFGGGFGGAAGVGGMVEEQAKYQMGPDGKPLLGPDGQPILATQQYELGPDGKPLLGPDGQPIPKGSSKESAAVNPEALAAAMSQMASLVFGDDPAAMAEAMRRIDDQKMLANKLGPMENERRDQRMQLSLLMHDQNYVRSKVMDNLATSDFFDPGMRTHGGE